MPELEVIFAPVVAFARKMVDGERWQAQGEPGAGIRSYVGQLE